MKWSSILAGVDGSESCVRAARTALDLAERAGGSCQLVHVTTDVSYAPIWPASAPLADLQDIVSAGARKRITAELKGKLPDEAVESLDVEMGTAAWAIPLAADRRNADLVVLGGKHHAGVVRMLGGSVAHHLVRTMDRPVLITGHERADISNITVAIDLGDGSDQVLDQAEYLAEITGATLRIVHVLEPVAPVALPEDVFDHADYSAWCRRTFDEKVGARFPSVEREVLVGDAADVLVEDAASHNTDVLVVGSHGKGFVDRMLLGSVTHRLLTALPGSLLVVPIAEHVQAARAKRREAS